MNPELLHQARELIAGFISTRRREKGLSQAALADKAGFGIATIKRLEDAKFWPNMKQFVVICHALDLEVWVKKANYESK
jgi:ribosome-binding protein aMBF1 (putative translation factor)